MKLSTGFFDLLPNDTIMPRGRDSTSVQQKSPTVLSRPNASCERIVVIVMILSSKCNKSINQYLVRHRTGGTAGLSFVIKTIIQYDQTGTNLYSLSLYIYRYISFSLTGLDPSAARARTS